MTTRRRNVDNRNRKIKSSSDEEEPEAASAMDYDHEMEDDDDVSQILMPNGDSKRGKNEYVNEYDEACAKL